MKNTFILFFLSFLLVSFFSCSSKDSNEEEIPVSLTITSVSEFETNASSQSISVTSNTDWTATANAGWFTITPSSGVNNGAINVTVLENTSVNKRSGTVSVNGSDISRSIIIMQKAIVNSNPPASGLDPNKAPSENFDLSTWKLNTPDNDGSGFSETISVADINKGYQNSKYFYTGSDGGMVFKCPVNGYKTSANTSYTRTELREMLRGTNTSVSTQGVNKNNWVFGTAPSADKNAAAGYDGEMFATLAVNQVTTTGSSSHVGRLIIGQIHANNDEPIRVYYRKLKENTLGSIYFAHEPTDGNGSEQWYDIIGSRSNSTSNPSDGIALDEKFSYTIKVVGNSLTLTIHRDGKDDVAKTISMANSGFNAGGQYMYFKAGIYHVNNSGNADDFAQATFYALEKSHTNN